MCLYGEAKYRMLAFDIGLKCTGYLVQKNIKFSNVLDFQNTKCVYMEKVLILRIKKC